LRHGRIDLEVDGVVRLQVDQVEAGVGVGDQEQVGGHVDAVAQVAREEVVQAHGRKACEQRREPVGEHGENDDHGQEPDPEEMRDRQDEAEEDRQPRPTQVVRDTQPDRV
jgi:hypothetical protein